MAQTTIISSIDRSNTYPESVLISAPSNCGTIMLTLGGTWTKQMVAELPTINIKMFTIDNEWCKDFNLDIDTSSIFTEDGIAQNATFQLYDIPQSFYLKITPIFDNEALTAHNNTQENGVVFSIKTVNGIVTNDEADIWTTITDTFDIELIFDDTSIVPGGGGGASITYTNHNGGIRGNNLGSSYTDDQKAAIAAGTFDDIYVGDYWEISGIKYYIADIDYYLGYGNPTPTSDHHVIVFPDDVLSAQGYTMDASYYAASSIFTTYLPAIATQIEATFGSFLISQPMTLFASSSASWLSAKCVLPSMIQLQGYSQQIPNNLVQQKSEMFSYFRYKKDLFASDQRYWLRDTDGGGNYAFITQNAQVYFHPSSQTYYLRPYFILAGTLQT